jgi:hypothetical protein
MARGSTERGRRRFLLVPVAAGALGLAALVAAYATLSDPSERDQSDESARAPAVELDGAYGPETGSDGFPWQWIRDDADLVVSRSGLFWVGFRAQSFRQARTLELRDKSGRSVTTQVPPTPVVRILGPFRSNDRTTVRIRPRPGASPAPPPDTRRLSVFLSMPTLSPEPAIVLPASGFWPRETESSGQQFSWLKSRGQLEVRATPGVNEVAVSATIQTAGERTRRVTVTSSGPQGTSATVVAGTRPRRVDLGVLRLQRGRGTLELVSEPGPSRIGQDPRELSVRIIEPTATVRG